MRPFLDRPKCDCCNCPQEEGFNGVCEVCTGRMSPQAIQESIDISKADDERAAKERAQRMEETKSGKVVRREPMILGRSEIVDEKQTAELLSANAATMEETTR